MDNTMVNETLFHDESAVFRAVTGAAYNIPNSYGQINSGSSFPLKGTIPVAVVHTGTFKTEGKVVRGTDTEFNKVLPGSYLYDGNVLRRVDYIVSDLFMFLIQAFPSDISSDTAVKICDRQYYKMVYAKSSHASESAILQEAPFRSGDTFLGGGAPVSYDANDGEISFSVHQ